jgi:hypothetical protein
VLQKGTEEFDVIAGFGFQVFLGAHDCPVDYARLNYSGYAMGGLLGFNHLLELFVGDSFSYDFDNCNF